MMKRLAMMSIVLLAGAGCTAAPAPSDIAQYEDLVRVEAPRIGATVSSPLTVAGEARGTWYFEATFPVKLVGEDGSVLAQGEARAVSNWMTEDYVPFGAVLTFDAEPQQATLVLERDNPSGLPEYDAALEIPVILE